MVGGCGTALCETLDFETAIRRRSALAAKLAILAEEVIAKSDRRRPCGGADRSDALGALATVIATAVALVDYELVVLAGTVGIPSVALAPLGDLLAELDLVPLPRVTVGALRRELRTPRAAAVAFERGGMGHPVSEWRSSRRSAADPA